MEETARRAAEGGFDFFCTTLSVSPHKDAALINRTGALLEAKYGVRWLPSDFKKRGGFLRTTQLCAQMGIYRQNYCGCTPPETVI
jgi:predicted adenine nucleotide alpha hydrolase (AANH) superfamily ATPase